MPVIKFVKEKKEIEVPEGTNLRVAANSAGVQTNYIVSQVDFLKPVSNVMNCHGIGLCGTCRVLITSGVEHTNKMTLREFFKFKTPFDPNPIPCMAFIGHEENMRLACCTKVNGDIEVQTNPDFNLFGENFFS